jgi:C4-dicarboxylate-binding protein DctP
MSRRGGLWGVVGLALVWAWGAGRVEGATIAFKCALATVNDVQHEWCKRYGDRLEKRSNGAIKSQVFPAGQLGSIPRMLEGIQLGTIEAFTVPPDFFVGVDPRFQILTAPFLFTDMDHAYRVLNDRDFADRYLAMAERKGIMGVSLYPYGPASLVAKFPIRSPDDMKGKKFRVLATPIETAMMAAVGATGVPIPFGEVLPALQQGAVDGVQSSLTAVTGFKFYDVAKYHSNTNHYLIISIAVISRKWYTGLPADLQKTAVEEGRAVQAELLPWTKNFYGEAVKTWKEKTKDGWIELTDAERGVFRQRMEGVDEKVAQQVAGLKEWLDLVRAKSKQHAK